MRLIARYFIEQTPHSVSGEIGQTWHLMSPMHQPVTAVYSSVTKLTLAPSIDKSF